MTFNLLLEFWFIANFMVWTWLLWESQVINFFLSCKVIYKFYEEIACYYLSFGTVIITTTRQSLCETMPGVVLQYCSATASSRCHWLQKWEAGAQSQGTRLWNWSQVKLATQEARASFLRNPSRSSRHSKLLSMWPSKSLLFWPGLGGI